MLLALCCAAVVFGVACSGNDSDNPTATRAPELTATAEADATPGGTPRNAALIDDVIDLAVQLETMTREQAVCVFRDHPSLFQEFLQESGLLTSGTADEAAIEQQIHDLIADNAPQLDRCFNPAGG